MLMKEQVIIFDTTLRDGEQSPGISLDAAEKLEIAEQLARLNVDYIEAGFPVASQGDFEAVSAIARSVHGPTIAALSRTHLSDVDRCWEALRDAPKARIHVFISTSPSHMEHMLKMSPQQVLAETRSGVSRAREHTADVEFSPQDATRTPYDFMLEVLQCAVDAGATTLNIPDTVGYGIPWEFGDLIANVRKEVHGAYVISTHCHNDLGLATANSLAGVQNGARQVEVCINGLGERAGNAALEEVVMALAIRSDIFASTTTQIKTEELARTSRLVSRLTGYPVQYNKSVVGRNAFAHESGIHQHGVLSERTTYEIIAAESVGQSGSQIILGKHSGRHAFADTVKKMGLVIQGEALNSAFQRFKELADRKVEITEADIEVIVTEEVGSNNESAFQLDAIDFAGSSSSVATATVTVTSPEQRTTVTAQGNGMLDAAAKALSEATEIEARLTSLSITAVTGGVDAVGEAVVQLESTTGHKVSGRASSTDVIEAAARAYLDGLNRLIRMRGRLEERDISITP
jgi:2-isopropylmalate synthase